MTQQPRFTHVPASRLEGWLERFARAHGAVEAKVLTDDGVSLAMRDGAVALLTPPWPDDGRPGKGKTEEERLLQLASQERGLGIVLLRRAGYAVGTASAGILTSHKCGSKYVQSKTAAGGQSQHRFARRRDNQADALVLKAAQEAARLFESNSFEYLATGGDKSLIEAVLAQPVMRPFAGRPRLSPLPVNDPNLAVLAQSAKDFASVHIKITDPS